MDGMDIDQMLNDIMDGTTECPGCGATLELDCDSCGECGEASRFIKEGMI